MLRFTWREIVLVIAIVVLTAGWFWHGRQLNKEFTTLKDRLTKIEEETNNAATPKTSQGASSSSAAAPDHSGVSLLQTLYIEEGR
jgi:hypothetical protein